ncbi:MAG TPA: hypothetical protein VD886_11530 [Herpetosiphonaceae bacterium]|nr:hypothetical protein [Herpetosiphonaceae bacterium]
MDDLFDCIVGAQLDSVTFVQDYVQLHFDGPRLDAYTWPAVEIGDVCYRWGEQDYRNQLCERIASIVARASVIEGEVIRVEFSDGAVITISLRAEDYCCAEAAMFSVNDGTSRWNVW